MKNFKMMNPVLFSVCALVFGVFGSVANASEDPETCAKVAQAAAVVLFNTNSTLVAKHNYKLLSSTVKASPEDEAFFGENDGVVHIYRVQMDYEMNSECRTQSGQKCGGSYNLIVGTRISRWEKCFVEGIKYLGNE